MCMLASIIHRKDEPMAELAQDPAAVNERRKRTYYATSSRHRPCVLCVYITAKTAAISFESKAKAFQEQRDDDGRE